MPSRPRSLTHSARLTLAVALLVAAACGSDDDPAPATGNGGADSSGAGTIVAEDFSLTDLTVAPGAEIVLQNDGAAPHTATADGGSFDLGQVSGGDTSDPVAAPDEPGAYSFHCEIHPNMTATLTVEG